jgi:ubiquinone/menaquinone biosynthesis C-methylase UbiE
MSGKFQLVQRVDFIKKMCTGKKVLHLGCTNSPYTEESIKNKMLLHHDLKLVAKELYGFDYDAKGLEIFKRAGEKNIYWADLENLDELDLNETFDVIVAGEMIEHLSNPGLFLRGIKRFMNEQTSLIITTINAYSGVRFCIYGLRGRGGANEPVHPDHVAYYSYKTLNLIIERENLKVKDFFFYDLGPEHRPHNHWVYNLISDVSVKISPQLSDGVIAVCGIQK